MEGGEIYGTRGKGGSRRSGRVRTCLLTRARNEKAVEIEEREMKR